MLHLTPGPGAPLILPQLVHALVQTVVHKETNAATELSTVPDARAFALDQVHQHVESVWSNLCPSSAMLPGRRAVASENPDPDKHGRAESAESPNLAASPLALPAVFPKKAGLPRFHLFVEPTDPSSETGF